MRTRSSGPTRRAAIALCVALLALGLSTPSAGAAPPTIVSFTAQVTDLNKITLNWQVTGGDSSNLLYIYDTVGFKPQACPAVQPVGCSTSFRVGGGGVYRYTLSVNSQTAQSATATIEVSVSPPAAPTVPNGQHTVYVDMFGQAPQSLSWTHPGSGFVQLTPPKAFAPLATQFPTTGTYQLPAAPATNSLPTVGTRMWKIRYCAVPVEVGAAPLCSASTPVTFVVGPSRFDAPGRRFVPANQPLTLSWSGPGNVFKVTSASLGVEQILGGVSSYTVPAAQVTAGHHRVKLASCRYEDWTCSDEAEITAVGPGTITYTKANNALVSAGDAVGTLTPDGGGTPVSLVVPAHRSGRLRYIANNGSQVGAGSNVVAYVATQDVSYLDVVVGGGPSVATWTTKAWSTDFTASTHDLRTRPSTGTALDITFDTAGDLWQVGEFGTAAARVQSGALTHHTAPYGRVYNTQTGLYDLTKPYFSNVGSQVSSISDAGERVIDTGSAIWFTQGGGLFSTGSNNRSRLIRFNRNGTDNPATPTDDRLCAVHVPGAGPQVIGVAHQPPAGSQPGRIWFTESRSDAPAITWFELGSVPCSNNLNYQDSGAVGAADQANAALMHRIALPTNSASPAQLVVDTDDGFVWFTDQLGLKLYRYPLAGGSVESFPLPTSTSGGFLPSGLARGYPWQIRVDNDAVYFNEYLDNQILRFDKTIANPTTACNALVNGANPCIKELFLPMTEAKQTAHSFDLEGGKLWFTTGIEVAPWSATGGSFGYVDVASWAAGTPTGVLYSGMPSLGTPQPGTLRSFRGIDVTATGKVGLSDGGYNEIVSLTPL